MACNECQPLLDELNLLRQGILARNEHIATQRSERDALRSVLETIAAQSSGIPSSTNRADCMAALAQAALRGLGEVGK